MKLIVKIEIVILILVVLVAAGMVLVSEGFLNLFVEPVIVEREPVPIPTDAPTAPPPEIPAETAPQQFQTEVSWEISAKKYFAYDIREGAYLKMVGDGDEKLYPASITKLLTCYVVLQHMRPDAVIQVGDALSLVEEDSSLAELQEGDELTVEQLIAAMLLPSGNDAAQVAAVATGRAIAEDESLSCAEAVEVFVAQMNKQAQALGMTNSHFANPDGWHNEDHYTTMNDLVTLCETVLANTTILKYTSRVEESVTLPDRTLEWVNTNFLLDSQMQHYLPNTIGLKTGYTDAAGSCLVSAFFMEDRLLLIGVFGCTPHTEDRYLDTLAIYNSL